MLCLYNEYLLFIKTEMCIVQGKLIKCALAAVDVVSSVERLSLGISQAERCS